MNDGHGNFNPPGPVVTIRGERIGLGPLQRVLIPALHRWFNNMATDRTQGDLPGPRTLERVTKWYEGRATDDDESVWFTIYALERGEPIGIVWLSDIDYHHRTAGFGISIGEDTARGKGYGTETTRLIIEYAFTTLGLRTVQLEVYSNNLAGLHAYQKAGFRAVGRRRECYRLGAQVHDEIIMEAVAE